MKGADAAFVEGLRRLITARELETGAGDIDDETRAKLVRNYRSAGTDQIMNGALRLAQ